MSSATKIGTSTVTASAIASLGHESTSTSSPSCRIPQLGGTKETRTCPCRGYLNRGEIPPQIRAHVIGPRLAAVMSYFSGRHHLSRRAVEEVVETVLQKRPVLDFLYRAIVAHRSRLPSPQLLGQPAD